MKNNAIQNKFYWTYLAGIFLILALPLLNIPPLFYPSAWAGSIVFRIIFSVLLFLFIWELLFKKDYFRETAAKIKNIPWLISIPLAIFVILVILSTIFSLQPLFSIWGIPSRGDGSLNLLFYIIFAIFCYLVVEKKDWQKVLNAGIIAAILVSFIAIGQQFKIFGGDFLVAYSSRPPSTLGNTDLLATYLLLFTFLTFVFALKEKKLFLKIFYFSSLVLFLFIILITLSRATFLGLAVGFVFFVFFYRFKNKSLDKIKIISVVILFLIVCSLVFYANTQQPYSNAEIQKSILKNFLSRLQIGNILDNERISAWKIALQGLKDRPLLGYGPENFSIVFDKYFDSKLSGLFGTWWDRAHNFLFDISTTMGIPALLAYLAFFVLLFYFLQKEKKKKNENCLMCLGIQATFIAYFVNNLFSFDVFGTYLIIFLIAGYSLSLISQNDAEIKNLHESAKIRINPWIKSVFMFVLLGALILFIWQYNILPLLINSNINWSDYYLTFASNPCDKSSAKINEVINEHSYLDNYLRLRYSDVLRACTQDANKTVPEQESYVKTAVNMMQEAVKTRPYYTRSWILLGYFSNFLFQKNPTDNNLKNLTESYFQKANQLSLQRPEIFEEWGKFYWIAKEYPIALEKFNKCVDLNPLDPIATTCWQDLAITQIYLGNTVEAAKDMEIGRRGFDISSESSLVELSKIYSSLIKTFADNLNYYKDLLEIYQNLIKIKPSNFQYHASLAYVYAKLGEYGQARQEAAIVEKLSPESKPNIDAFLQTLPQ